MFVFSNSKCMPTAYAHGGRFKSLSVVGKFTHQPEPGILDLKQYGRHLDGDNLVPTMM